jgi:hypothetical protein
MISTVEKIYQGESFSYKVILQDGTEFFVPHNEANRHYQEILEWVANGGTITDPGA